MLPLPLTRAAPFVLIVALATVPCARAQTSTTGAISGVARDQLASVLPAVRAPAIDEPTGMRYEAVSDSTGQFHLLNVRAGGPSSITARLAGFLEQSEQGVIIPLGTERTFTFIMS